MYALPRFSRLLALGSMLLTAPAIAKNACPPDTLGPNYPWIINDIMPGDQFAEVYLDFDKAGEPSGCRLGNNNIPRDDQFNVCLFFAGFVIDPKSHVALPTTIKRLYLDPGPRHQKAQQEARKRYFQEHPYERADCYPSAN
jgi:hypothetical protein